MALPPERRRLLAIDGGGVRGVVALEVIAGIERTLRQECDDPDLRLGDWFDYIGGTSTGAIIAAGLALGRSAEQLLDLYVTHAKTIFQSSRWRARIRHRYDHAGLATLLKHEFGETTTLGSGDLRCLLMIGLRNASTDSPWPVSSNPNAAFNDPANTDSNLQLPLWQLVRASTAAPTYFPSEHITFGSGTTYVFSDGATTTLNNPALQLALMAMLPEYRLEWPRGPEQLLLISVGTGAFATRALSRLDQPLWQQATAVPAALISSVGAQQDMMCRVLGQTRHGAPIDAELGSLHHPSISDPLFSYARYDAAVTEAELRRRGLSSRLAHAGHLDAVDAIPALRRLGRSIAEEVTAEHFAGFVA
ncbi:patatin-like phospholipase family protein [Microbacterium sp. Mu-80]|uniref:Patatin-like phospholipase family protein n=1 Tax=Microbacterium bandirmense TaxID=3122050 RepID=A0ABU8LA99_9MICO